MYYYLQETHSRNPPADSSDGKRPEKSDFLEGIRLFHIPRPSGATPMERFMTLSPVNDPHPWMAKAAMQDNGIGYGAMETAELRKYAAEMSTTHIEPDDQNTESPLGAILSAQTSMEMDVTAHLTQLLLGSGPLKDKCRIFKRKRQRMDTHAVDKRHATDSANGD